MIGSVPLEAVVLEETAGRPRLLALAKSDLSRHPATARLTDAVAVSSLLDRIFSTFCLGK